MLSKDIYPKILRCLDHNKILFNLDVESIQNLVCLQQKLLSLTAIKYGIYDIRTCSLANNYLCSLAFRIVVVLKLFNNVKLNTLDTEKTILKPTNYCKWVKYLSYANVLSPKVNPVKKAFLFPIKSSARCSSIYKVSNRLVQMLFVLVYEPILECVSDACNFGYRKSRHLHQAIGALFNQLDRRSETLQVSYFSKYVLKYGIRKLWDSVDRN